MVRQKGDELGVAMAEAGVTEHLGQVDVNREPWVPVMEDELAGVAKPLTPGRTTVVGSIAPLDSTVIALIR